MPSFYSLKKTFFGTALLLFIEGASDRLVVAECYLLKGMIDESLASWHDAIVHYLDAASSVGIQLPRKSNVLTSIVYAIRLNFIATPNFLIDLESLLKIEVDKTNQTINRIFSRIAAAAYNADTSKLTAIVFRYFQLLKRKDLPPRASALLAISGVVFMGIFNAKKTRRIMGFLLKNKNVSETIHQMKRAARSVHPWEGKVTFGKVYDASLSSTSWEGGYNTLYVGKNKIGKDFGPRLSKHIDLVRRYFGESDLLGYFVYSTEEYEVAFQSWISEEAANDAFARAKVVIDDANEIMDLVTFASIHQRLQEATCSQLGTKR